MGKLFGSGSGGSQTSTTESSPWKPAQDALEQILGNAGDIYDKNGGINGNWVDKNIADLTPEMQGAIKDLLGSEGMKNTIGSLDQSWKQGVSGIGQATGMLGGLAQQGITSDQINQMAKDLYNQDMVDSQTGQLTKTVQEGLDKNIQGLNQQSSASGNMGSSRAGVAEGVAVGEAADAIATGTAGIQNAASQQAMAGALGTLQGNQNTALGAAGQLGQLGLGSGNLGLGTLNGQNQILQNQLQGALIGQNQNQNVLNNQWFNQQGQNNAGWDNLSKYMGFAGAIGGMGGTNTTTGTANQGGMGTMQGLVGMGSTIAGLFSDASMKKKIKKKKGKTKTGEDKYEWEWNKGAEKAAGLKGKSEGVLAQAVDKKSGAVGKDKKTGKLFVDYDKV